MVLGLVCLSLFLAACGLFAENYRAALELPFVATKAAANRERSKWARKSGTGRREGRGGSKPSDDGIGEVGMNSGWTGSSGKSSKWARDRRAAEARSVRLVDPGWRPNPWAGSLGSRYVA